MVIEFHDDPGGSVWIIGVGKDEEVAVLLDRKFLFSFLRQNV